eukprot:scaffold148130_cov19-Tisochrysis_lutea.AAC.1
MHMLPPCLKVCFCSSGSRLASSVSITFSISTGFPNCKEKEDGGGMCIASGYLAVNEFRLKMWLKAGACNITLSLEAAAHTLASNTQARAAGPQWLPTWMAFSRVRKKFVSVNFTTSSPFSFSMPRIHLLASPCGEESDTAKLEFESSHCGTLSASSSLTRAVNGGQRCIEEDARSSLQDTP